MNVQDLKFANLSEQEAEKIRTLEAELSESTHQEVVLLAYTERNGSED